MNKIYSLLVVIFLTFRGLGYCIFMQIPGNSLKSPTGKDKEIFAKKPKKPKKKQEMSMNGVKESKKKPMITNG